MDLFFAIIGMLGAGILVLLYFLLQQEKVNPKSVRYFAVNGFGAFLILVSLLFKFDITNTGGVAIELSWVVISLMGVLKALKQRK